MADDLEDGWLERQLENLPAEIMAGHDRNFYAGKPWDMKLPYPASWEDAEKLFAALDRRFKSWTGRTLAQHSQARPRRR